MSSHDWVSKAACAPYDPEDWFPSGKKGISQRNVNALMICHSCPVRLHCLETAIKDKLEYGIWGGTFGNQRRRMITKLKIRKHDDSWRIEQLDSTAIAHTWQMAITFAHQLLKKEKTA
jgi:WhiB family transcriptional regulator, redox-sensing transcriptional regulator